MKELLMTILLSGGIILTSVGIHEHNIFYTTIAGCMIGVYNALIQKK